MPEDITKKEIRGINLTIIGCTLGAVMAGMGWANSYETKYALHEYRLQALEKKAGVGVGVIFPERREIILFDDRKIMTLNKQLCSIYIHTK